MARAEGARLMHGRHLQRLADEGATVMEWTYDQASDVMSAAETVAAIRGVYALAKRCSEELACDANQNQESPTTPAEASLRFSASQRPTAAAVAEAVKCKSEAAIRFSASHSRIFERLVDPATREDAFGRLIHLCAAKAALERGEYPSYEAATAAVGQYLFSEAKADAGVVEQ